MHDIDLYIGFSTSKSWISKMIRWFTKSKVSHVFISVRAFGTRLVIGADEGGLDWRTINKFEQSTKILYVFKPLRSNSAYAFEQFIEEYSGAEYDWIAAGNQGIKTRLKILWKIFGKWLSKKVKSNRLMCSEAVTRFLQQANYDATKGLNPEAVGHQDLLEIAINNPKEFKREVEIPKGK